MLGLSDALRGDLQDVLLFASVVATVITASYLLWQRVIRPVRRARQARFAALVAGAVGERFDRSEATIDDLHHRLSSHLVDEQVEQRETRDQIGAVLTTMQDTLAQRSAAFAAGSAGYIERFERLEDQVPEILERLADLADTAATVKSDLAAHDATVDATLADTAATAKSELAEHDATVKSALAERDARG